MTAENLTKSFYLNLFAKNMTATSEISQTLQPIAEKEVIKITFKVAYDRIFGKRFLEETTETSLAKIFTVSNESSSLNFCSLQFIDSGCSL